MTCSHSIEFNDFGNKIANYRLWFKTKWLNSFDLGFKWINNKMGMKKEGVLANLYLMKIYFLIIKRFMIKKLFSRMIKIFH